MTKFATLAVAASILFLAGQAQALTLTNRDAAALELSVGEGEENAEVNTVTIAPEQTLEICPSGCDIAIPDGALAQFEGHEVVSIQGGQFVVSK